MFKSADTLVLLDRPSVTTMKYYYGGRSMHLPTTPSIHVIQGNPFKVTCSSDSRLYPLYKWTGHVSLTSKPVEVTRTNRSLEGHMFMKKKML